MADLPLLAHYFSFLSVSVDWIIGIIYIAAVVSKIDSSSVLSTCFVCKRFDLCNGEGCTVDVVLLLYVCRQTKLVYHLSICVGPDSFTLTFHAEQGTSKMLILP
jgi:hypothetical protein